MTDRASTATNGSFRRNVVTTGVEILVNIALPVAIFDLSRTQLGEAQALLASSAPPLAWSILEFIRRRRVDALSMLVLTGIVLSFIAFFGGGGVRALQLREKLVTGLIGLIFLGSAAIRRPLIFYLARATMMRSSPVKAAQFSALRHDPRFKGATLTLTLAWGFGLVIECALAVALTYVLPMEQFLLIGPVLGYGYLGGLTLWTIWFARRRIGAPLRVAVAAAEQASAVGGA